MLLYEVFDLVVLCWCILLVLLLLVGVLWLLNDGYVNLFYILCVML